MPVNRLTIESATQTATHTSTPVNISGISGDCTIKLIVKNLSGSARIQIEESTNGFSTSLPLMVSNWNGGSIPVEGELISWRRREACGTSLFGATSAELRLNLIELNGLLPTITYNAYIEY